MRRRDSGVLTDLLRWSDWTLFGLCSFATLFGMLLILSATHTVYQGTLKYVAVQGVGYFLGLLFYFLFFCFCFAELEIAVNRIRTCMLRVWIEFFRQCARSGYFRLEEDFLVVSPSLREAMPSESRHTALSVTDHFIETSILRRVPAATILQVEDKPGLV